MTDDLTGMFRDNPFPSTGIAGVGIDITKIFICKDGARADDLRTKLIDKILIKANAGACSPSDPRAFALIGNVGKGKTHLVQHIIRRANGENVQSRGIEFPKLDDIFTIYTIPHSPSQVDAAKEDKINSWLFSRIINFDDDPRFQMGMAYSPSIPENKRKEFINYVNSLYQKETGKESVNQFATISFEKLWKLLKESINMALRLSNKKAILLVLDEMESPVENLQQSGKLSILISCLKELNDRVAESDLPLYIAFCFTIQPWYTLESSPDKGTVQAFMSRLQTNKLILQVKFTDEEIREFIELSLGLFTKDKTDFKRTIKKSGLSELYPFCVETPQMLRRYFQGDPRLVCQHCSILFDQWFKRRAELTFDYVSKYLDEKITVNTDLFRTLCDKLGDLSYVIKVIKDNTRMMEFDVTELEKLILEKGRVSRPSLEIEKVVSDLRKIVVEHDYVLTLDEKRHKYVLGSDFQNVFGYIPDLKGPGGIDPRIHIEAKLKETKYNLQRNPQNELAMLKDGLVSILRNMGRNPMVVEHGITVELPDKIVGLYYPIISGKITAGDVTDATELARIQGADCVTFVGKIPISGAFDRESVEVLERLDHPKSKEYLKRLIALEKICKKVGKSEDLDSFRTQSTAPMKDAVSVTRLYTGNKVIDKIPADCHIWIMASAQLLSGITNQNDMDYMGTYLQAKINPVLQDLLIDEGSRKVQALRDRGDVDHNLPTANAKKNLENILLQVKTEQIARGLSGDEIRSMTTTNRTNLGYLVNMGLLTENYSLPTIETMRKNPFLWLVAKYIQRISPTRKQLFAAFESEAGSQNKLNILVDMLKALGRIDEESGKLRWSSKNLTDQLSPLIERLKGILTQIDEAGVEIDENRLKETRKIIREGEKAVDEIAAGKRSETDVASIIPGLGEQIGLLGEFVSSARAEGETLRSDLSFEKVESLYREFSRAYGDLAEGSKKLNLSEIEISAYLAQLSELEEMGLADLETSHTKFAELRNDFEKKYKDGKFGAIVRDKESYKKAKRDLEIQLGRAKKKVNSNLVRFADESRRVTQDMFSLKNQWAPSGIDLKADLIAVDNAKLEKMEYADEINRLVHHRAKLISESLKLVDAIESRVEKRIEESEKMLATQMRRLEDMRVMLNKYDMLDDSEFQKTASEIESMKKELGFEKTREEMKKIRDRTATPGLFEKAIREEIRKFCEDAIGEDGSDDLSRCGPFRVVIKRVRDSIDRIPERMLKGDLLRLYREIKEMREVNSEYWHKLESKYGNDLAAHIVKLIGFDLVRIKLRD